MPYHISWHITQCLVLCSILNSGLSETTPERTATDNLPRTWTSPHCPEPPKLKNGIFLGSDCKIHAQVQFHCSNDYDLIGPSTFICLLDGDVKEFEPGALRLRPKLAWVPDFSQTRCVAGPFAPVIEPNPAFQSTCSLPKPRNPYVEVRDWRREYPVNAGVLYTCKRGYTLVGEDARWCMVGGKWSSETEPKCIDSDDLRTTVPPITIPGRSDSWSIMKIILYISIPLLVVFVVAIVCNLRVRLAKRSRQSGARSSVERNDTTYPQLLPTRATGYAGFLARPYHQQGTAPSAPPSNLLNSDYFAIPIRVTVDSPGPVIQVEPPSYEEATRDSNLPSFEVAQKLHNSSENLN